MRHAIDQLRVELDAPDAPTAKQLMSRLSALGEQRLADLLNRVCGEFSGPGRLDRLDTLEVSLPPMPVEGFEEAFLKTLEAELRRTLRARIARTPQPGAQMEQGLELLWAFATTGALPLWAQGQDRRIVALRFDQLAQRAAPRLAALVRRMAPDSVALRRIANHCDDQSLRALAGSLGAAELIELLAVLPRAASERERVDRRMAALCGQCLQPTADGGAGAAAAALSILLEQAAGSSARPGIDDDPDKWLQRVPAPLRPQAHRLLQKLEPPPGARPQPAAATDRAGAAAGPDLSPQAAKPAAPHRSGQQHAVRPGQRATAAQRGPGAQDATSNSVPTGGVAPSRGATGRATSSRGAAGHATSSRAEAGASTDDSLPTGAGASPSSSPVGRQAGDAHARAQPSPGADRRSGPDAPSFESPGHLYIVDAGLVILWPFVERFFQRLGLLDERRGFVDPQARMRAVASLSLLSTGQPEPPEFQLPLPKLLCGLAPRDAYELVQPLDQGVEQECEHLLATVIGQVPGLRKLTSQDLRRSFLVRPGMITTRHHQLQLHVERQAQDLVLDQVPWSWHFVKLAWMPAPLEVRW